MIPHFNALDALRIVSLGLLLSVPALALLLLVTRHRDRRRSWWPGYTPKGCRVAGAIERLGPYPAERRVNVGRWR